MSVGILGSGFGLYGYLPALTQLGQTVVLPERYREKLRGRKDVGALEDRVQWVRDEEAVLAHSSALVIGQRPGDQLAWVDRALAQPGLRRLLLEKPLAPEPAQARHMLQALAEGGRTLRVGFTFRYTAWGHALRDWLQGARADDALAFDWRFRAHHYAHDLETWKRRPSQGGGALRFYGIHLIAFLAELGYRDAQSSRITGAGGDDAEGWEAVLTGPGLPPARILVDSNAAGPPTFAIAATAPNGGLSRALTDPFDEAPLHGGFDRRVDVLSQLCRSLLQDPVAIEPWCRQSVALWAAVEEKTDVGTHATPATAPSASA